MTDITMQSAWGMRMNTGRPDYLNTRDQDRASRREFLKFSVVAAGTLAASLAAPGIALSAPLRTSHSEKPVRVSKERLNALAAKFYGVFNEHDILPKDFSENMPRATTSSCGASSPSRASRRPASG